MPTKLDWLAWAIDQVHPQLNGWYSQPQRHANLSAQLELDIDRMVNLGATFERAMPVVGAGADMYNHRVFELAGMEVMLGIRFRGRDIGVPFVDLVRASEPITKGAQVQAICDLVRREFAIFKPLRVRFYQPSHIDFPLDLFSTSGDKRVLAAPLTLMLSQPEPVGLARVSLRRVHTLAFYSRYHSTYAQTYLERPWLPQESHTHSPQDMQEYLEAGQVFEIFVDDRWAGITCSEHRMDEFGLQGFAVGEMLLDPLARGQGLGAAVQYRLAEAVQASSSAADVLYGTIGSYNTPMLKTATRAGRVDLGGWIWVELA